MDDCTLEQARELYRTVRMFKSRLGQKFQESARASSTSASGEELTFAQCNVMMTINDREEVSLKELADILHVSRPSASSMVDRLVEIGMVDREQSQVDRREVCIRLSPKGSAHFQGVESQILECITELLVKMGPQYASQWCAVYARLRDIIEVEKGEDLVRVPREDGVG